jgi:hypothetical protein
LGGAGIASCVGSTPSGSNLPTGTPGMQVLTITATDNAGNVFVKTVNYRVLDATNVDVPVDGSVPGTLSLTLGPPVSLGAFTPGLAKDYTGTLAANVISTAGQANLSVTDASSTATGRLVNGAFALPQPLQLSATSAAGLGSALAPLSSTAGTPLNLLTYAGPTSNDAVTVNLKQAIGATDALRTGTYSKTLTFTLSTTTP